MDLPEARGCEWLVLEVVEQLVRRCTELALDDATDGVRRDSGHTVLQFPDLREVWLRQDVGSGAE